MFVNRTREIEFLDRMFDRPGAQMVVIWGRRRVGKTALLQQFGRGRRILFHAGTLATERTELGRWSANAAEFFDDPVLIAQPIATWEAALAYLSERARRSPGDWGIVFDEFPYLVESSPRLPSLLQAVWDERLKDTQIRIVLCGSSVAMMESAFFGQRSPLYGRRTGQWRLEPFGVDDLGLMFPGKSLVELLELFTVIGGVPLYAERFGQPGTLASNIRDHILTKGEMLYEEVPFLLRQEFRDPRVYQSILSAVAGGAHKFGEISSKTGLDRAHLTGYLASLADLGIVGREVPVTEEHPEKSRRGQHIILDPFVRFWYRFVYTNLSRLEVGETADVLASEVLPRLPAYTSRCVEAPLADLFRRGSLRRWLSFEAAFVGRHWSPTEEFDVVAMDHRRERAFVAEVKWSGDPVSTSLVGDLRRRIAGCAALRSVDVTPAIVSRSGFRGEAPVDAVLVDLSNEPAPHPAPSGDLGP